MNIQITLVSEVKSIYTRNENGQLTQRIDQDWNSVTQEWVNESRIKQYYDNEGVLTQVTTETWSSGSSAWVNSSNQLYAWEGNVRMVTIQNWSTSDGTWVNDLKLVYHYEDLSASANNHKIRLNFGFHDLYLGFQ